MNKVKNIFKRGLCFFAAMLLIFQGSVASVANATSGSLVKNLGEKTENGVTVEKIVEPVVGKLNTFKITLKVKTKADVITTTADTVLVIDTSRSMSGSKFTAAKAAAKNLAAKLIEAGSRVAIVNYGNTVSTPLGFSTSVSDINKVIDNLKLSIGTYTQGGIHAAIQLLNDSTADFKNIVLLSDGEPNHSVAIKTFSDNYITNGQTNTSIKATDFDYSKTIHGSDYALTTRSDYCLSYNSNKRCTQYVYYHHGNSAIAEAGFFKDDSKRQFIYTVALSAGTDGTKILKNIASANKAASTENENDLNAIFEGIGESISNALNSAVVTDPMAQGIVFNSNIVEGIGFVNNTLSWTPRFTYNATTKTYSASYSYEVYINDEIFSRTDADDGFYEANGTTTLTYNNNQKIDFKVPFVKPIYLEVSKELIGQEKAGQTFTITVAGPNGFSKTANITADGTTGKILPYIPGKYSITETATSNNNTELKYYTVSYDKKELTFADNATVSQSVKVTNILETTSVHVTKSWDDNNNQDGIRKPVTVKLFANGNDVNKTITLTDENQWQDEFANLYKYENGNEIVYTVAEVAVDGYETLPVTGSAVEGYIITNKHNPAKTSINFNKVWDDNNDQDGKRVATTVTLYADGKPTNQAITIGTSDAKYSFTNLDKYKDGQAIAYTVVESAVDGYESVVTGSAAEGYIITNKHTPETTTISGSKTWDDNGNQDGKRPGSITVNLLANNSLVDYTTASEATGWTYSFDNLPVYKDGRAISYSVVENDLSNLGYTAEYGDNYSIINHHTPATVSIKINKAWIDDNDRDGLRRDISFKVIGTVDGQKISEDTMDLPIVSLAQYVEFKNLPKYNAGKEISYKVYEEVGKLTGYTNNIPEDGLIIVNNEATVTNVHNPELVSVSVVKKWNDENNIEGLRPESISINLLANGEKIDEAELSEVNKWSYTFANLWAYSEGKPIEYTISEGEVANYTSAISGNVADGYVVTNSREVEYVSISAKKVWNDNNDQDGKRARVDAEFILMADGIEVEGRSQAITTEDDKTYTFDRLQKYVNGKEVKYTVTENLTSDEYESSQDGSIFTNTHTPETIDIVVSKQWSDDNNYDGLRNENTFARIILTGTATGYEKSETKDIITKLANTGDVTFANLPKYYNGEEIVYIVEEVDIPDGYTPTISGNTTDGYVIVNYHKVEHKTPDTGYLTNDIKDTATSSSSQTLIACILAIIALFIFSKRKQANGAK